MSTIISTQFKLPQSVVGNGVTTGNGFTDPDNILLVDGDTAKSAVGAGESSDIIIGNFNLNLPQGAIVTGILLKLVAKRGVQTVPDISITPVLVNNDNDTNTNEYYPGTAYTGLTTDLETHYLGGNYDLFGKSEWTADQINNLKVQLIPSGDVEVDCCLAEAIYYIPGDPTPVDPTSGHCEDCNSTIEALPFVLASTFRAGDTSFILKSFGLIDGTPITLDMLGECGGEICITFDKGQPMIPGNNFQEDAVITSADATISNLPNGYVKIELGDVTNRGLLPITPYVHDADLMSDHNEGTKVIISNNARYQSRFLQKCHIGVLVSPVISVDDEGLEVVPVLSELDFIGDNVQAEQDSINPEKANVTFVNNPTNQTPTVEETSTGTTGDTPDTELTISHETIDANYLRVAIQTDNETIVSVTYDGVPMALVGSETNAPADLKVALYDLINPTVGVNDVVITMASPSNITSQVVGWLDVDTTDPVDGVSSGAIGTSTVPADSITTTTQNTIVQDVVGSTNNPTTFAQSGLWAVNAFVSAGARTGATSSRRVLSPGLVNDEYDIDPSSAWAIVLAGIRGLAYPPSGGVQSVTGYWVDNSDPANPIVIAPKTTVSTGNPTVTDDDTQGYSINSQWFNKNTDIIYVCTDVTTGAAVWEAVTGYGSDSYTVKATATDTTPSFLDDKVEVVSTDNTVTVTPSIINPGGNEKLRFDLSASGSGSLYTSPNYDVVDPAVYQSVLELSDGTFFAFTPTGVGFVNYSISPDKTKAYKMTITYTGGSNYNLSLEEYTGNGNGSIGTLANTYTASGSHTVGNNNYSGALFVNGNTVFIPLANGTASTKYTEYTISGANLITPVVTNLDYETTNTNYINYYWFHDGTDYYIWNFGGSGNVRKFTYAAGTFTAGASSSGVSKLVSTQSISLNAGVYRLLVNYFKIESGKVVNLTCLKTSASTLAAPVIVSGVLLANNVTAP